MIAPPDLNDPLWPKAVTSAMAATGNAERLRYRAAQLLESLQLNLEGLSVLEVGCGTGFLASGLAQVARRVVGQDLRRSPWWPLQEEAVRPPILTTDLLVAEANGPYDFILAHDVIDHLVEIDPIDYLRWMKRLLRPDGQMLIRFHPWTARHGAHLYEQANLAHLQLLYSAKQLAELGLHHNPNDHPIIQVTKPLSNYGRWIEAAGLKVLERTLLREPPEAFFDYYAERILQIGWQNKIPWPKAWQIMAIQFVDYRLGR